MLTLRPCWSWLQSDSLTALLRCGEELLPLGVSWLAAHEEGSANLLLASCPKITFKQSTWGYWNLPLLLCFLILQLLSSRSKSESLLPSRPALWWYAKYCILHSQPCVGLNFQSTGIACYFLQLTNLLVLALCFSRWMVPLLSILFFSVFPNPRPVFKQFTTFLDI